MIARTLFCPRQSTQVSGPMVRSRFIFAALAASCAMVVVAGPSMAAPPAAIAPSAPENRVSARSTEQGMLRLAEIMGALAWLRGLCGADDGSQWRDRMSALLDAEATSPERKARLAGAFNDGYRAWRLTHNRCTPSGELAIQRFLKEGEALAAMLSSRIAR